MGRARVKNVIFFSACIIFVIIFKNINSKKNDNKIKCNLKNKNVIYRL